MPKLTRKEREQISNNVTDETKRCVAAMKRHFRKASGETGLRLAYKDATREIIAGAPYLKFHPELKEELKSIL